MASKKFIKKEISTLNFFLLITGKLLIGIGLGVMIATHFYAAQPYWFLAIFAGAAILIPTLYKLSRAEAKKEIELEKKVKKRKKK